MSATEIDLSVVAPAFDEEPNLRPLHERVRQALSELSWELVIVDDGSTDGSARVLAELAREDGRVRPIVLPRNRGQTTALTVGFRHARGRLVATLDADLQSDPGDLLSLLAALGEHDAVVGYRMGRKDDFLRRLSSTVANGIRNRLTGDDIRDTGCPLKLFRREAILSIPLFEGMHRFLPTLLRWHGYSVVQVPVPHYPRVHGKSKYGVRNRALRSFRDLLAVRWMRSRLIMPHEGSPPEA